MWRGMAAAMSESPAYYESLPPQFSAMMRLFEDDVTPKTVEAFIDDYRAELRMELAPGDFEMMEPSLQFFLDAVRRFAGYGRDDTSDAAA